MTTSDKQPKDLTSIKQLPSIESDEAMEIIENELTRLEEEGDDPQIPPMLNKQLMDIWFTGYIARISQQLERLEKYNLKFDISQFNVILADIRKDLSHLSYEFSGVKVMISYLQDDLALQQGWVKNFDVSFGTPIKKIIEEMLVENSEKIFGVALKKIVGEAVREVLGEWKNDR